MDEDRGYEDQVMKPENGKDRLGAFVSRLGWIFYSPSRVFADIERDAVSWWEPWIWLGLLNIIIAYISIPIQLAVTRLNPRDLPEETLEQTIESMEQFGIFGVVAAPIVILIVSLITGLIGYVLVSILSAESSFKRFFTVYLYSSIVASFGVLISVLIVRYFKGLETIRTAQDASFSFGLGFLASPDDRFLKAFFQSLDLFGIWSLVLIGMGLMHIFKMTRNHAVICVIPLWLLGVLMMVIGTLFGGS